ncbi:MAG: hypothetical protein ACOY0T_08635 [Myxococcota bacterium]
MDNSKMKVAYVIVNRNGKKFWNRVGAAFVNGDGSINVKLEAVPVSGEIQIRDYVPREDQALQRSGNGHGHGHTHVEEDVLSELA